LLRSEIQSLKEAKSTRISLLKLSLSKIYLGNSMIMLKITLEVLSIEVLLKTVKSGRL
jgi:hypothetical protein